MQLAYITQVANVLYALNEIVTEPETSYSIKLFKSFDSLDTAIGDFDLVDTCGIIFLCCIDDCLSIHVFKYNIDDQ